MITRLNDRCPMYGLYKLKIEENLDIFFIIFIFIP
jgi:hypothetical protein